MSFHNIPTHFGHSYHFSIHFSNFSIKRRSSTGTATMTIRIFDTRNFLHLHYYRATHYWKLLPCPLRLYVCSELFMETYFASTANPINARINISTFGCQTSKLLQFCKKKSYNKLGLVLMPRVSASEMHYSFHFSNVPPRKCYKLSWWGKCFH